MIRKVKLGILAAGCLSVMLVGGGLDAAVPQADSALELYQRALVEEQAVGNLPEAIELYRRVAESAGDNRTLAAEALIHAAGAYEKLEASEAAELYAEVMRTFPEQTESVSVAVSRLEVLTGPQAARGSLSGTLRTNVSATLDPVLSTYCTTCHNQELRMAGLALDTVNTQDVAEASALWENILRRLRAQTMPPSGRPRMDAGTHQSVVSTLELALDQAYPPLNTGPLVTDLELASRMANFLWWGGVPDQALLDVASQNRLREPAVLEQQVRRMLADGKSTALVTGFFESRLWSLENLESHEVDPVVFPSFDERLRQSFGQETRRFFEYQIRQDRPAMELWTANYTFLNESLAEYYGVPGVSGNQFRRVEFPDFSRGGLLGQGSVLTVSSLGTRTSPTVRGKLILRNFFGQSPPDPPPNIPALPEDGSRVMRVRLEEHLSNSACLSCHVMFDPLGYALQNFDAVGRWRNSEGGSPIDASGAFIDGRQFSGPAQFRAELVQYRDAFLTHVTGTLLTHGLGRDTPRGTPYPYEMPEVRAILREAAPSDYRWSSIILGIVKSTPFQMQEIVP